MKYVFGIFVGLALGCVGGLLYATATVPGAGVGPIGSGFAVGGTARDVGIGAAVGLGAVFLLLAFAGWHQSRWKRALRG